MVVQGLENNYYLAGNNIWLKLTDFSEQVLKLELICTNQNSGVVLKKLTLYPSPANTFEFNLSEPIRALFIAPDHIANNNLQSFSMAFKIIYTDVETPPAEFTETKYFIRGFKKRKAGQKWFLNDGDQLIVGPPVRWIGVALPSEMQKIQTSIIGGFIPTGIRLLRLKDCAYKVIKFRNSLGGYQYFIFEAWTTDQKAKSNGFINNISYQLTDNSFDNLGSDLEETIELKTTTPFWLQDAIADLVMSSEVYLFDAQDDLIIGPSTGQVSENWIPLALESNTATKNSTDFVFENSISFKILNTINNAL